MNIIIVGGGKVGYSLAKQLSEENHEVTIIDQKNHVVKRANEMLKVMCIKCNGASIEALLSAGIKTTDLLIAVTAEDELNMICCLMAKKLGAKYTVARIRNPEYSNEAILMQEQIGIDRIMNPELVAARDISRLVRFPDAVHAEAFAQGRVEMIGFKVKEEDQISSVAISDLPKKLTKDIIICAIDRNGKLIIPHGDDILEVNDIAYIMATRTNTSKFFKSLGRKQFRAKDVMIAGGGKISVYLAQRLNSVGINVIIIEENSVKCHTLSEFLPFATIIHGDGTDPELLYTENISGMDYFVAATDSDEENIFAAMNAKKLGAKRSIVKLSRDTSDELLPHLGIECAVKPKSLIVSQIIRYVRGKTNSQASEMLSLYKIIGNQAEAVEFLADNQTSFLNQPIKTLKIKKDILICAIMRGKNLIIPTGDTIIEHNDHVILIVSNTIINSLNDILR